MLPFGHAGCPRCPSCRSLAHYENQRCIGPYEIVSADKAQNFFVVIPRKRIGDGFARPPNVATIAGGLHEKNLRSLRCAASAQSDSSEFLEVDQPLSTRIRGRALVQHRYVFEFIPSKCLCSCGHSGFSATFRESIWSLIRPGSGRVQERGGYSGARLRPSPEPWTPVPTWLWCEPKWRRAAPDSAQESCAGFRP